MGVSVDGVSSSRIHILRLERFSLLLRVAPSRRLLSLNFGTVGVLRRRQNLSLSWSRERPSRQCTTRRRSEPRTSTAPTDSEQNSDPWPVRVLQPPAAGSAHVFDSLAAALVLVPVPAITSFRHYISSCSRHNKAPQAILCDGTSRLRLQHPGANRGMPFAPTHYVCTAISR